MTGKSVIQKITRHIGATHREVSRLAGKTESTIYHWRHHYPWLYRAVMEAAINERLSTRRGLKRWHQFNEIQRQQRLTQETESGEENTEVVRDYSYSPFTATLFSLNGSDMITVEANCRHFLGVRIHIKGGVSDHDDLIAHAVLKGVELQKRLRRQRTRVTDIEEAKQPWCEAIDRLNDKGISQERTLDLLRHFQVSDAAFQAD